MTPPSGSSANGKWSPRREAGAPPYSDREAAVYALGLANGKAASTRVAFVRGALAGAAVGVLVGAIIVAFATLTA